MKWTKRILIIVASLLLLVVIAGIGINLWISRQLPRLINKDNTSLYNISYKSLDYSILDGTINASEIIVVPRVSLQDPLSKAGIYGKIGRARAEGVSFLDIVKGNRITARKIFLDTPEMTLLKNNGRAIDSSKSINTDVIAPFSKIVYVSDVVIENGGIKITEIKGSKPILDVKNIAVSIDGIFISDKTLEKKIPFTYKSSNISFGKVFYRANQFYHITTSGGTLTDSTLNLGKVKLVPRYSRSAFVKSIPTEKDLYAVAVDSISFRKMKWGFTDEKFFFDTGALILDGVNADIYRSKIPRDDLKKKKLYSRLLRQIPFRMSVGTLLMRNSKIVYEEEKDPKAGPGNVVFSKFNMRATGIASAVGRKKMADVKITANCRFMEVSPMRIDWRFNTLDQSDAFHISGRIMNFPPERLAPFSKPYMNATVKGDLDEVYFNISGNDKKGHGTVGVNYDDLKVTIYKKKDPKKKNKLKSFFANLFVKNDSKGKVKKTDVDIDRIPEKSFYNLLWRCVWEGLKKIMI